MSVKSTYSQAEHPEHEVDEHTGRFDTGEELEPEKDRAQTGQFDTCDEPSN